MNVTQFNQARETLGPILRQVSQNPTPDAISQLMLHMAKLGLVAVPFEHYPDTIPQPLCAMVYIPTGAANESTLCNTYLVPVDQLP